MDVTERGKGCRYLWEGRNVDEGVVSRWEVGVEGRVGEDNSLDKPTGRRHAPHPLAQQTIEGIVVPSIQRMLPRDVTPDLQLLQFRK